MRVPALGLFPQTGDLIVCQLPSRHGLSTYLLHRLGRRQPMLYTAYVEARARAERQAALVGVDAWYTSDDDVFIRIAEHRPPQ